MPKNFDVVNYNLRPSKQTERKVIVEVLLYLAKYGIHINEYKYLGMGSIYFVDFKLFHKYLHINQMICVEKENIPKRLQFNCPYDFIEIHPNTEISDIIPKISSESRFFVWLDYTGAVDQDKLNDLGNLMAKVANGSIVLISMESNSRSFIKSTDKLDRSDPAEKAQVILKNMNNEIENTLIGSPKPKEIIEFSDFLVEILNRKVKDSINARIDDEALQIMNYKYKDGANMVTVGWLIDSKMNIDRYQEEGIDQHEFINTDSAPLDIRIPQLTYLEKKRLDKNIKGLKAGDNFDEFELAKPYIDNYLKFYKHYPSYQEGLID
ncbi:MAG: hypothetical protein NXI20_20495 [bacterium]|nr:hypothetical protein [bacterium]